MKIVYDPYIDALSITFREGVVKKTLELAPEVLLDIDAKSRPLHLEIIGAKEKIGRDSASEVMMKNLIFEKRGKKELTFA